MQRWTAVVFVALVAGAASLPILMRPKTGHDTAAAAHDAGAPDAATSAAASASAPKPGPVDAGAPDAEGEPQPGEEIVLGNSDAGATMLDGKEPPPLPEKGPKSVIFGVILIQYKGAQAAPPTARSREEALELAKQLAADAKQDFKAAVQKGDKGSMENAGRMPLGMLERAPEAVLFNLPKDGVSDPVDTPRGFWIVRRIE